MLSRSCSVAVLIVLFALPTLRAQDVAKSVAVDPAAIGLTGPGARYSLLVHGTDAKGRLFDLTRNATYRVLDTKIARVTEEGVVLALADGKTQVAVEAGGQTLNVAVEVTGSAEARRFHFENDIVPLLNRFSCNSAGCHGAADGQNGFKLSVFGFDPPADYVALIKEARGRRIMHAAPDNSLLLAKASGKIAHGGGTRIRRGTLEYDTIRGWIAAGTPIGDPAAPHVESIRVEPSERSMTMRAVQQLRVVACYSNGDEKDVTHHARFQSNNDGLASVAEDGQVTAGDTPGEVAVMANFMGAVATFRAIIPRGELIADYPKIPENNFIDTLAFAKLKKLNIVPSELADDATYLRRVYLDVIGTLPTAAEARRFLDDKRPERRAMLVDELLKRTEFADFWALQWADVLRVERATLGHKNAYGFYKWIRDSVAANKPLDVFAREIFMAEGPLDISGPANFYKVVKKPGEQASTLSQVFLGVRIACAECHHHPFDRWSQTDYFGMQAFFTPLRVQKVGRGEVLLAQGSPQTKHPRSGETIAPHALGTKMSDAVSEGERRTIIADWLTAPQNPWFARNLANRMWAHFMGRGLIEPVDDVRDTNPPSNPELLDALAKRLIEKKYDLHDLIRTVAGSRAYQLASQPNKTNENDEQNFSRAQFRRVNAEVLLDMVSQATGISEKFEGVPSGYRAIQLWDSNVDHYFLKLFGRPVHATACECERNHEPGVAQILHLLNSPNIQSKLGHERGTVAELERSKADNRELIIELYLTFYARMPSEVETAQALAYFAKTQRRRDAAEDLAWSLLNSLEFVFNH